MKVRTSTAQAKWWRALSSVLVNRTIPFKNRARIYCACVRLVMLNGAETWVI